MSYTKLNPKLSTDSSFPRRRESNQIQQAWIKLAYDRLEDIDTGKVETLSAESVFNRINKLLS